MRGLHRIGAGLRSASSTFEVSQVPKSLPNLAETVIIGGGAIGCSIAYHLAKLGQKGVVLLEKTELTAGSTWHAAGLTALYHPTPNMKQLHYYSINLYTQLENETGQNVGFHQPGSIRLATSPVRMDEFRYQMSRQLHKDAPQMIISPDTIKSLCPILNMDGILGGLYNPNDGHIDPYSLTQALAIGARKYGASIYQKCSVSNIQRNSEGLWEVQINSEHVLKAKNVVNAAGFWAREVGQLAGLDLPLVPVEHQYLITTPIDDVNNLEREIPVLRHLDGSFYLRQERENCLLVGPYESQESMKLCEDWATKGVPPGFGKELFPSDLDRLNPHLKIAMELVPCFASANVKTVVCGPITYTPDLLPMAGPSQEIGMWLAVGFGYGIIHAGGIGRYLAEWILKKEPPYELIELDPCRYGTWTTMPYTFAKARESYGMNNAVPYPHEERTAGRPTLRRSGIFDVLLEKKGQMSFHSGWEQPSWFAKKEEAPFYQPSFKRTNWHSAVQREWQTVRNHVGIIDLSPFGKLYVRGPDSTKFLDFITANHVPKAEKEETYRICISHCLTPSGKVYAELTVTSLGSDEYFLVTGSGSELHDLRWLRQHAEENGYNVSISNVTDELGCLSIAGPKSGKLLEKLCPNLSVKNFKFFTGKKVHIDGIEVLALRLSYTGELGWEFYCNKSKIKLLYEKILNTGKEYSIDDFGTFALQVLRMEKGFRMWGADMNKDTSPIEAGLHNFIKINKGSFIGQNALEKEFQEGLTKTLVPLLVDSPDVDPKGDEAVWCAGKVIGNTTSGCFSYHYQKPLAFAYVPPFLSTAGTNLQVDLLNTKFSATVLPTFQITSSKK
ncbi:uncharacterized protein GBIM_03690 [Gryllus bimaculatus]|nr:uncharacterized protein GBIM_03690 [Gryllus bimaculatus]